MNYEEINHQVELGNIPGFAADYYVNQLERFRRANESEESIAERYQSEILPLVLDIFQMAVDPEHKLCQRHLDFLEEYFTVVNESGHPVCYLSQELAILMELKWPGNGWLKFAENVLLETGVEFGSELTIQKYLVGVIGHSVPNKCTNCKHQNDGTCRFNSKCDSIPEACFNCIYKSGGSCIIIDYKFHPNCDSYTPMSLAHCSKCVHADHEELACKYHHEVGGRCSDYKEM